MRAILAAMSNERSPRGPNSSLPDALVNAEKLYSSAGRSAVSAEISAASLGYSGLNGASRTALAALSYYGLIQREGDTHKISELGLRLIRPLNPKDKLEAARTSVEKPPVFADIAKKHPDCAESVLASILLHAGFTDDGARRAARVYKENVAFVKSLEEGAGNAPSKSPREEGTPPPLDISLALPKPPVFATEKMLAHYQIPLGANHAEITFTGEELVAEDFDALKSYVELFKKQFERRGSKPAALQVTDKLEVRPLSDTDAP